ncbi:MAG TPA: SDR family oxidoreductase [Candidatus Binatia bacterium]|nr:SDR family oxidoreductase [Candidatus Binatia bacterium]
MLAGHRIQSGAAYWYARSFVRTWTTDLKKRRIRVNAMSPGSIDTPGLSTYCLSSEVGEQQKKLISNTVSFGRFGTPMRSPRPWSLASDESRE